MKSTKFAEAPVAPESVAAASASRVPATDLGVNLGYSFQQGEQSSADLSNPLFELLAAIAETGSITHAARRLGCSYRYVWGSLRKWEKVLGEPLVTWLQGRKARPTDFAQKLVWAERRARIRMQPHIEALRADLGRVLHDARDARHQLLTVRASHDLALPVLRQHAARAASLHLDLRFQGSVDALRSLTEGQCLVAAFHVPALRGAAPVFATALKPWLKPKVHQLIACSNRTQGLMIRTEHARIVRTFPDVARHRLRFVNRQPGAGTRLLIDHLMHEHSVSPGELTGYAEHVEHTHVSVALCVASGVADVGVGIEAAALQFGLHFVPVVEEAYFLACLKGSIQHPALQRLREVLAGERWREILVRLPGYRPAKKPGGLLVIQDALPWWRTARRTRRPRGTESASS